MGLLLPGKLSGRRLSICIALFIVFCYFSASYFLVYCIHHDEHFQILEFANFKRGLASKANLAWEFEAGLRPSLQAALAYICLNIFKLIGIIDPYDQAFAFRIGSSMLFLFSAMQLYKTFSGEIDSWYLQTMFFIFSFFFYMFPVAGVRFSSENMSSCFFVIGFTWLYPLCQNLKLQKIERHKLILIGSIFGISFLFRYQSAILIAGLAMWLLRYHSRNLPDWLWMFAGFIIVFLIGILIDFWFYEKWVFSAFNYLNFNIIQGGSATFGVSPWHFYITAIDFRKWLNVLNISLLFLVLMFLFIKAKHAVTWIFYPFLIVHSLIAHKETRFIYPILIFLPFIVVSFVQYLSQRFQFLRFALWPWIGSLLIVNLFAFIATTVSVADNSTEIFKFLRKLPDKPVKVYYQNSFFFYTLNDGAHDITPLFYKTQHIIKMEKIGENPEKVIDRAPIHPDTLTYIVLDKMQQEKWGADLKLVYDPQPEVVKFMNYHNWMKQGASQWKLYQLGPNVPRPHSLTYSP